MSITDICVFPICRGFDRMTVLKPPTAAALIEAVSWATANKAPLEVVGRGTKRALGRPSQSAHVLDVSELSGIRLYEPAELVMTAAAGTPLAVIEAALTEANQHLAFEPPDYARLLGGEPGEQSLAGVIAANLAGPRRLSAGAARDHLLGFSAVSGRGEAFKSGGRVVKNVTGYDLSKLACGSWGTLAVLTEVSLKVLPRPDAVATVALWGLDAARAVSAMSQALGSPHDVSAAAWLPSALAHRIGLGPGASATMLRLEGPAPSVAFRCAALGALLDSFGAAKRLEDEQSVAAWRAIRDVEPFAADRSTVVWKVSVPPMAGAAVVAAFPEAEAFLDWGGGLVWLAMAPAPDAHAAALRAVVSAHGGHATLIRGEAATRAAVPVFEPQAKPLTDLIRRVKHGFDPEGILNPGRLYAGI
jgi:glycolate oxidase FAD binding subunit